MTRKKPASSRKQSPIPDHVSSIVERCLGQLPVIVLGSGASMAHGIPGMPALQSHLLGNVKPSSPAEEEAWLLIRTALAQGDDLESALSEKKIPEALTRRIVEATWDLIAESDSHVLEQLAIGALELPLTRLLRWLTRSTHYDVAVVTTNYDRLAEYAADAAGLLHLNGFAPGYVRERETTNSHPIKRGNHRLRTAQLWKVHGSLDWFQRKCSDVVCARMTGKRPSELHPVIVTPGIEKFLLTHLEPFRSVITGADGALSSANSVLCVGYGFRDIHIEPKLVDRCKDHGIPLVVIAKALTNQARSFMSNHAGRNFVAFEEAGTGTRAICHGAPEGITIPNLRLWDFGSFLNHFVP